MTTTPSILICTKLVHKLEIMDLSSYSKIRFPPFFEQCFDIPYLFHILGNKYINTKIVVGVGLRLFFMMGVCLSDVIQNCSLKIGCESGIINFIIVMYDVRCLVDVTLKILY